MHVIFIGAAGKICHHGNRTVSDDADARFEANRADKAGDTTERCFDFLFAGEAECADPGELIRFDFIQFVVATQ